MRQGEEYKHLRGPESVYGDAWDFRSNKEGIIRFWEDGLKRGGRFENVITVGMRGEFDSKIMGEDATLKDNIDLLRDVLKTQNRLIKENVNTDIDKVPRMLALYKEVEPFFYGDEDTEGLKDDPELEGVTLMLCDDNFGNLRTLPTVKMRDHKGGYGMYYHFDYHGWPVSYEWINSSNLPKVWEQMTTAYEFGIRELWIVNVGDIFTNEYPLSYFLDLAYDYDKWGILNPLSPDEYTKMFVEKQFGDSLDKEDKSAIEGLLKGYTKILSLRRPEAMNDKVFDPVNYCELEDVSTAITELMETADTVSARLNESNTFTFFQL
ncbi:MAG: glycosyl hydrolase 115 family protein, partial [Lachnospiraceae bacterium]|nr:glycosyl hydrolase 115 family protein [Lachnospiraceae bacterium]